MDLFPYLEEWGEFESWSMHGWRNGPRTLWQHELLNRRSHVCQDRLHASGGLYPASARSLWAQFWLTSSFPLFPPVARSMSSLPLEMSDTHSSPLLAEPPSSRYKLCESEFTGCSWPSSPQDTHPALPLLEMLEVKVRNVPPGMLKSIIIETKT